MNESSLLCQICAAGYDGAVKARIKTENQYLKKENERKESDNLKVKFFNILLLILHFCGRAAPET